MTLNDLLFQADLVVWCFDAGIDCVSLYDSAGEIKRRKVELVSEWVVTPQLLTTLWKFRWFVGWYTLAAQRDTLHWYFLLYRPSRRRPKFCWQLSEMFHWLVGWCSTCLVSQWGHRNFLLYCQQKIVYIMMAHPVLACISWLCICEQRMRLAISVYWLASRHCIPIVGGTSLS